MECVTYNSKKFLAPESITSMAAIHCKIKKCGEITIRISDCNNSIKLWNKLENKSEISEFLQKMDSLLKEIQNLKDELKERYPMIK